MKTILKKIVIKLLLYRLRFFGKKGDLPNFDRILVIAPHPDDEIFGLGGYMLHLLSNQKDVYIIYFTDGENSGVWPEKELIREKRIAISQMICNKIGIQQSHIFRLHIPDGCIPDSRHEEYEIAITLLVQILEEVKPDALFVTHSLDFWPYDHVHSSQIAIEAKKRFKNDMQLWFYFVWAWYNVKPLQLFKSEYKKLRTIKVDKLDYKRRLVNLYLQELTPNKKPWSGILPSELIDAVQGPIEVIEKFDRSEPEVMK